MSETPNDTAARPNGEPMMRLLSQYLKDLSFESPQSPQSLRADLPAPNFEVQVDVGARGLQADQYEVELSCSVTATREDQPVFVVETNYAGLFLIQHVPPAQMEPILLVEAPRLLFPFARRIIDTAVRDGGINMPMLEPLDFAGMYRAQLAQRAQAAGEEGGPPDVGTA